MPIQINSKRIHSKKGLQTSLKSLRGQISHAHKHYTDKRIASKHIEKERIQLTDIKCLQAPSAHQRASQC